MRKYINLSKGIFHKQAAHLYCFLVVLISLLNILFLLTTIRGGHYQFLVLIALFVPIMITAILSGVAIIQNKIRLFKVYTMLAMVNIFTAAIVFSGLRTFLNHESVRAFSQSYAMFITNQHNYLPVIQTAITFIIVGLVVCLILIAIAIVLVSKNIQPKSITPTMSNHIEIATDIEEFKEEIESV